MFIGNNIEARFYIVLIVLNYHYAILKIICIHDFTYTIYF